MRPFSHLFVSTLAIATVLSACSQNPHLEVSDPPKKITQSAAAQETTPSGIPVTQLSDRDHDGIFDNDDLCPDMAGPQANRGCPYGCYQDRDRDGVSDDLDQCPDVFGLAQNNGCPLDKEEDKDEDGVQNTEDRCPQGKGGSENQGCPYPAEGDIDQDGVLDDDDLCSEVPGSIHNNGCPLTDSDNDGVSDKFDSCPKVYGPASNKGCPLRSDRDGDWVEDEDDLCPTVRGQIFNDGCPSTPRGELDTDGDGVTDTRDQCKYAAGPVANFGCPFPKDEEREVLLEVKESLKFVFDQDLILASSYPALDKLVAFLKKHPNSQLKMVGHTDDVGADAYNQTLSEQRIEAVRVFLISRNIQEHRIEADARGESEPLESIDGKEGRELEEARAQNRRVDMSVSYKEVR